VLEKWIGPPTNDWGSPTESPNNGYALDGSYDSITYGTCKRGPDGFRPTMPCEHFKASSSQKRTILSNMSNGNGTRYKSISSRYSVTGRIALLTPPTLPDLNPFHVAAMDYFRSGCVDKEVDIPVSLIELGEVKRIVPQLKEIFSIQKFVGPQSNWRSLTHYAKKAANLHLLTAFGILPLINDVVAVHNAVKGLRDKIAFIRKNEGQPIKVEYRKKIELGLPPNVVCPHSGAIWETLYNQWNASYKAFAVLKYETSSLNSVELALRLLTRELGFDNVLGGAWELIPFSFIIDWLLHVDRVIASISPTITLPTVFIDLGYCVKVQRSWTHRWVHYPCYNGDKAHGSEVQLCQQSYFLRRPGLPVSFSAFDPSLPGNSQLWTGLSLFVQRKDNFYKI